MHLDTVKIRAGNDRSPFRAALVLALLPALFGIVFAQFLTAAGLVSASHPNVEVISTLMLFAAQDGPGAVAVGALVLCAWLLAGRTRLSAHLDMSERLSRRIVAVLAVGGAGAAWLTAVAVFRGYGLSLDEYLPQFQAEIFRHGRLLAPLSPGMEPYHANLQPFFTYTDAARGLWASQYRPGHALLLALMPSVGGVNLLNPLLTAISVWAMASIARRLWPDRAEAPVLAAVLLLASPQVIVTAGSGFAYTAHLAFNLVWLALFLKGVAEDRMLPHLGAALVGAYAIGLHQVHVHPLFAAPFLTLLLLGTLGRRSHLIPYIVLYLVALPLWVLWPELAVWITTGDASALPRRLADVNYLATYLHYTAVVDHPEAPLRPFFLYANLLRFLLWLSPAVVLLGATAMLRPRRLGAVGWAAAAGIVLTVAANQILMPNQMLTWGARYYHPVIGNVVLLALAGYMALGDRAGDATARRVTEAAVLLVIASVVVLLPQRLIQVHAKVAPRAAVQKAIDAIDADVVVVPSLPIWFRFDFVRNSPFLTNRPLIVAAPDGLANGQLDQVVPLKGARIHVLTMQDLQAAGLPHGTLYEPGPG